ncbi:MAG: DUF2442 domain-containing protein [Verrucomicrobiota bacterium]|nr:DUF2442 domain-containing protein [Verrucomicrobiota bacterium]
MNTLTLTTNPTIQSIEINDEVLVLSLHDGRVVSVPIVWYPRLAYARPGDRLKWQLIGQGHGIHWPALDEDISVENVLQGMPSGEGSKSFKKWLDWYNSKDAQPIET